MRHHRRTTGCRGERLAETFLCRRGYTIIARNFRTRAGEIDLVAEEGGDIVFVEVKTRRSLRYGEPGLAVTPAKQRRLSKAALAFLAARNQLHRSARFDVVAIFLPADGAPQIELFTNAFDLCYGL